MRVSDISTCPCVRSLATTVVSFFNNCKVLIIESMATLMADWAMIFTRLETGRSPLAVNLLAPPNTEPYTKRLRL